MEVKCGTATGRLYISKYRSQGRSSCILCSEKWYTLTQFQEVGGRASSKNWKKSISHRGQTLQKFVEWLNANQLTPTKQPELTNTDPTNTDPKPGNLITPPSSTSTSLDSVLSELEKSLMINVQTIVSTAMSKIRDYIDQEMSKMSDIVSDLNQRLVATEAIVKEMQNTSSSPTLVQTTPSLALEGELSTLRATVSNHQHLLEIQQREVRRNNIIIAGLDQEIENENQLEVTSEFLQTKLSINSLQPIRARRLGRTQERKKRLMLVTMASFNDKREVMKAKSKLKGSGIYINDDLTPSQRQHRNKLLQMCRAARSDGKQAFIRGPKIIVEGAELDSYPPLIGPGDPVSLTHAHTHAEQSISTNI